MPNVKLVATIRCSYDIQNICTHVVRTIDYFHLFTFGLRYTHSVIRQTCPSLGVFHHALGGKSLARSGPSKPSVAYHVRL